MAIKFVNNFSVPIQAALSDTDTEVNILSEDWDRLDTIASGDYYIALLDNGSSIEYIHITDKLSSPKIQIERAKEGTSAIACSKYDTLAVTNTAAMYQQFAQSDTHADVSQAGSTVVSNVDDINFTTSNDASINVTDDGDGSVTVNVSTTVPVDSVAGKTGAVSLTSSDVGLGNVPNEDATDPVNWDPSNADGNFLVGDGSTFVAESGSTARTSLGLGDLVTITWSRKTANFTASAQEAYKVDSGLTVTLPGSPNDNDYILFSPLGDMTSSATTIDRNGNNIMGLAENMTWDSNSPFALVFDSTNSDWRLA